MSIKELDISAIVRDIRRKKLLFVAVIIVAMGLMAGLLHFMKPKYTVTMVVAPVTDTNTQSAGGLGALARLGGVNLGGLNGGTGQFQLFLSALTSRDTADVLAQDPDLMHRLFDGQWSEADQRWKSPGLVSRTIASIKSAVGIPVEPWHAPNGEQVYDLLSNNLQIDDDPRQVVVSLRIQSAAPETAKMFLLRLDAVADNMLRARALTRATGYVAYLNEQLEHTTVAEYRAALTAHLGEQEQTRMMASARGVSFAAQMFSAPSRSPQPTSPKGAMMLFLALAVGAMLGGWLSVRAARRERARLG